MFKRLDTLSRTLGALEGGHLEIRVDPNSSSFKEIAIARKHGGYDLVNHTFFEEE
ncbi:MAG TPA: hypothetical protein VJA47_04700 [archaeon]|nr:hypothetical protein [archaeon]